MISDSGHMVRNNEVERRWVHTADKGGGTFSVMTWSILVEILHLKLD